MPPPEDMNSELVCLLSYKQEWKVYKLTSQIVGDSHMQALTDLSNLESKHCKHQKMQLA